MTSTMTSCIVIFVVSLVLYAINKLPMGVVGMATLAALVLILCLAYGLLYFGQKHTAA